MEITRRDFLANLGQQLSILGLCLISKGNPLKATDPEDPSAVADIDKLAAGVGDSVISTVEETPDSPEYLGAILSVYRYALGPEPTTPECQYIDITDNFRTYGPLACDPDDDNSHRANRNQIRQTTTSMNAFFDVDADDDEKPVALIYGLANHTFERKFDRSQEAYDDGTLLGKTAESFDLHFAASALKNLLDDTGNAQYFRDLVIYGLVAQESGWDRNIESKSGAKGLFQAMDDTMAELVRAARPPVGMDPYNPEDAARFAVALFDRHFAYLTDGDANANRNGIGRGSFLFLGDNVKRLLVPLIITSFNAGMGRLINLAEYLISMHEAGSIPEEFYVDRNTAIFNENAIVWLLSRAYTLAQTDKLLADEKTDADVLFQNRNSRFGPDGAQYFLKILATKQLYEHELFQTPLPQNAPAATAPAEPATPASLPPDNSEEVPPNCRPDGQDASGDPYRILKTTHEHPTLAQILEANGVDVPGWEPADGTAALSGLEQTTEYRNFIEPIQVYGTGNTEAVIGLGDPLYVHGSYFLKCPNLAPPR